MEPRVRVGGISKARSQPKSDRLCNIYYFYKKREEKIGCCVDPRAICTPSQNPHQPAHLILQEQHQNSRYFYFLHFLRIKCADRQGQEKHAFSDPTPGENDKVEPALTKNDTVEPAAATEEDQPTEEEEEEPGKMSPEPVEK